MKVSLASSGTFIGLLYPSYIGLPYLLGSSCQTSENNLKALDQDTDEEVVKHQVELEEILIVSGHFLSLLESQHH